MEGQNRNECVCVCMWPTDLIHLEGGLTWVDAHSGRSLQIALADWWRWAAEAFCLVTPHDRRMNDVKQLQSIVFTLSATWIWKQITGCFFTVLCTICVKILHCIFFVSFWYLSVAFVQRRLYNKINCVSLNSELIWLWTSCKYHVRVKAAKKKRCWFPVSHVTTSKRTFSTFFLVTI